MLPVSVVITKKKQKGNKMYYYFRYALPSSFTWGGAGNLILIENTECDFVPAVITENILMRSSYERINDKHQ